MNLEQQDPTEKHYNDVGILVKYKDNNLINKLFEVISKSHAILPFLAKCK